MNRLKRIAAWGLLIVLCFSIFPCKVAYAADNGFTIEDNSGNTYSAVATDLVNSVDYTDTNTKIYCVWVPDSVTSLTVKSKKYTNAACHCDNNKITCESNNGELTATVLTETEHDSWCLKESLESGDVAGAESYIDWNSATSLFTVHLMTGEDLDNLGENVMIFVQVGGTKLMEDPAPFTIEDNSGNTYSAEATDLVNSVDYTDTNTKIYCVWVPDSVTSLTVKSKKYTNAACHCDNNKITCESNNGELTATVLTETEHDSWCLKESLESGDVAGAESYIDWNSATSLFTVHLMTGEDLDNLGENVMIFVQVGGTKPGRDVTAPELVSIPNSTERTSDTTATIKFTSNEAGKYFYSLSSADDVDTDSAGIAMFNGENTLNITGLTAGDATVYIKAKDVLGNVTESALEIAIPAYIPTYDIHLMFLTYPLYNKGYRIVSATADGQPLKSNNAIPDPTYKGAQEGQTIKVTLYIPEADKELNTVSLITDDKNSTPVDVTVNSTESSFTFIMPAVNVRTAIQNSFTLKESSTVRYNLKANVSLLYSDLADIESNRQGTVTFTDDAGVTLMQARPGQKVTVTAEPMAYKAGDMFKREFVCWKNTEGISVDEENSLKSSFSFTMPENDVYLFAEFKNIGTEITWGTNLAGVTSINLSGIDSSRSPFVFADGTELDAVPLGTDWIYQYEFIGWTVTRDGVALSGDDLDTSQLVSTDKPKGSFGYATYASFKASGDKMTVTANFRERNFGSVAADVNDDAMGSATVAVGGGEAGRVQPVVYEGQTVTLTATPGERYMLKGWEVKDADKNDVTYTVAEDVANVATFIMPDTGKDITAKAIFEVDPNNASTARVLEDVELAIPSATVENTGPSYTITVPANTDADTLAAAVLKFTVSKYADVVTADGSVWPEDGKACGMTLDTPVTFTVRSEKCRIGKDDTAKADYTVTITKAKSSEKDITAVKLLNADKSVIAEGKLSGTTWTITLPSDTDKALINKIGSATDVYMQVLHTGVSVKQEEGWNDADGAPYWNSGDAMCGISVNTSKTFTVTAEDSSAKTYTVAIKYTAPNAPTLSNGSATRTSKTGATVKFTTNEAGTYYYKVVTHGAAAPTADEIMKSTTHGTANAGETTITLSNLTEDARDIYIVVVGAAGGESTALKVEIPAYGSGSETPDTGKFTITINAPKDGTITTNRTKADKGDEIIVTVKPDSGYQMVEGSLTYSLAVAGGETVKITGNRFTMPAGNVTITCKWETATTTAKGITSFSINGVAGAVNNTTNTITITMPRGTDVTKLTPVIATNGVKSLTPGSGETVNFTNAVTYTAAMEDGSSKTYTVTVYVDKGTLADQFWDKLTDFATQVPWWQYAEKQQSTSKYPKYW